MLLLVVQEQKLDYIILMEKVLVTGSAGFIGYHLTKALIKDNKTVLGIDNFNKYYDINLKFDRVKELGLDEDFSSSYLETSKVSEEV